jgi:hypothetical protein
MSRKSFVAFETTPKAEYGEFSETGPRFGCRAELKSHFDDRRFRCCCGVDGSDEFGRISKTGSAAGEIRIATATGWFLSSELDLESFSCEH